MGLYLITIVRLAYCAGQNILASSLPAHVVDVCCILFKAENL